MRGRINYAECEYKIFFFIIFYKLILYSKYSTFKRFKTALKHVILYVKCFKRRKNGENRAIFRYFGANLTFQQALG